MVCVRVCVCVCVGVCVCVCVFIVCVWFIVCICLLYVLSGMDTPCCSSTSEVPNGKIKFFELN